MTTPTSARLRLRGLTAGLLAALALAGCDAMPIGAPVTPEYRADGAQAQTDIFFQPGAGRLATGEPARISRLVHSLGLTDQDDVIVQMVSTGSLKVDRARLAAARGAIGHTKARVSFEPLGGFPLPAARADVGLLQIRRYNRVIVDCRDYGLTTDDLAHLTPLPPIGCTNAINRAQMAADMRDLTAPRQLDDPSAVTEAAAVKNYRDRTLPPPPFSIDNGN